MSEIPRELTIEEIHELVEQFGDAAERAKKAGFDAVEMHGAHGYLIGAFVSPLSNLIIYRMSTVEYAHGGLAIEEAKTVAMILEDAGIDAIHCSQGIYVSTHAIIPSSIVPRAAYVGSFRNRFEDRLTIAAPLSGCGRKYHIVFASGFKKFKKCVF